MQDTLDDYLIELHALLNEIHQHPRERSGRLRFPSMAEVPDPRRPPQDARSLLIRQLRTLGREIHRRGNSLHQVARAAIRDTRDASVIAAAWDGIGGFYK